MATEYTGDFPLKLTGNNIWRGGNLSNGKILFANGVPHLETGYSKLTIQSALQTELDAAGAVGVPFGNAVWYDRNKRSTEPNGIYAGVPTASGAVPKFAGILAYDAGLASGQPVANNGVQAHNKAKLVKLAYVHYKTGKNAALNDTLEYADINDATMCLFFENATGDPVFAVPTGFGSVTLPTFASAASVADVITALSGKSVALTGNKPTLANCTFGGFIVGLYPEQKSVLVKIDLGA